MTQTPTARSLDLLRKLGWKCEVVEVNMRHPRENEEDVVYKKDLFGFADIIALKPKRRLLVQTTDTTSVSKRIHKIQCAVWFEWVKQSEFEVHVHGWDSTAPHGYKIIDMTARDAAGEFIYKTLWSSIFKVGRRSRKRPRTQEELSL